MAGCEGGTGDEDFARESHAAVGDGVVGSGGEAGGSGHRRLTVTHDALSYLVCQLSWVRNHNKHQVCLSNVDLWVSCGSLGHSEHAMDMIH